MSLKYSNTTADFLAWNETMNLIRKLYKDGNYNMSLLIALGCFFGLRIGDILSLRQNQILNTSEFTIIEKEIGKKRTIRINPQFQRHNQNVTSLSDQQESMHLYQSERYNLFSTKNKHYTERTEKEIQVAYR